MKARTILYTTIVGATLYFGAGCAGRTHHNFEDFHFFEDVPADLIFMGENYQQEKGPKGQQEKEGNEQFKQVQEQQPGKEICLAEIVKRGELYQND